MPSSNNNVIGIMLINKEIHHLPPPSSKRPLFCFGAAVISLYNFPSSSHE